MPDGTTGSSPIPREKTLAAAQRILDLEIAGLQKLRTRLDDRVVAAVDRILGLQENGRQGRVVVSGMGKAGLIGQKIAATLASTGTPSFWMHPAEAMHGDLGMILKDDLALLISYSGESEEVLRLLPFLKRIGCAICAVTGNAGGALAEQSDLVLNVGEITEACPLKLAPSATTTAMLALGDVLALTVLERRGFTPDDFARLHPAGSLGRRLLAVETIMRTGDRCPMLPPTATVRQGVEAIKTARSGLVILVDGGKLAGVFSLGDFGRRWSTNPQLGDEPLLKHRTFPCKFVRAGQLVAEAFRVLGESRINALPVVDGQDRVVGLLDIQDLPSRV
ncbi:MAG TPA: KpsF/GutQ family sugar-phosphate isomerase [Planctomycetota bacterium]|nr:KpsF/GutQ family sugar-phosphate isomerase [Planctomycetota bacterium]